MMLVMMLTSISKVYVLLLLLLLFVCFSCTFSLTHTYRERRQPSPYHFVDDDTARHGCRPLFYLTFNYRKPMALLRFVCATAAAGVIVSTQWPIGLTHFHFLAQRSFTLSLPPSLRSISILLLLLLLPTEDNAIDAIDRLALSPSSILSILSILYYPVVVIASGDMTCLLRLATTLLKFAVCVCV